MAEHRVTLGRVAGVYGVRGWVRIISFTRPASNILEYPLWWIAKGDGFNSKLIEGRVHGRGLVAQIGDAQGVPLTDRNFAESLIGSEIQVSRSELPPTAEGQFYLADLLGLRVQSEQGDVLGVVTEVTSNGAQDVLVMKDAEVERMIPFVQGPIIKSVDMGKRLIIADWLPEY
ncbi:MAG: ribosome maturation factor RimM [Stenotrophobium sp.]